MGMQQGLATSKLMKLAMQLQLSLREIEFAPVSLVYFHLGALAGCVCD